MSRSPVHVAHSDFNATAVAHELWLCLCATRFVDQVKWCAGSAVKPSIAPAHDEDDGRVEVQALFGQPILVAKRPRRILPSLQNSVGDEFLQPICQHCWSRAELLLNGVEPSRAEEGLPQDQKCPRVPNLCERTLNGVYFRSRTSGRAGRMCHLHFNSDLGNYRFDRNIYYRTRDPSATCTIGGVHP